jgi:hypothetical protein
MLYENGTLLLPTYVSSSGDEDARGPCLAFVTVLPLIHRSLPFCLWMGPAKIGVGLRTLSAVGHVRIEGWDLVLYYMYVVWRGMWWLLFFFHSFKYLVQPKSSLSSQDYICTNASHIRKNFIEHPAS